MRLFFAIWPDANAARALERLSKQTARAASGRAVAPDKIHLTLAFLGEVEPQRVEAAKAAAGLIDAPSFDLVLDCVGSFRGARVAWAGSRAPCVQLIELQARLAAALREQGFALEARLFLTHFTLARRIANAVAPAAIEPIRWRAHELTLMESQPGTGRYLTQGRWVLSGSPPEPALERLCRGRG